MPVHQGRLRLPASLLRLTDAKQHPRALAEICFQVSCFQSLLEQAHEFVPITGDERRFLERLESAAVARVGGEALALAVQNRRHESPSRQSAVLAR